MIYKKISTSDLIIWVVAITLSGIGIASILMLGPYIQAATLVLVGGESSEIYDGLRKQGIEGIAAYWEHFFSLCESPVLICGLVAAAAMAVAKEKSSFLFFSSISVALGWTAIDIYDLFENPGVILPSLLCNLIGGIAFALYGYVVHIRFAALHKFVGLESRRASLCLWIIWPFAAYVTLSFLIFFILSYVIKIPTEPVSVTFESPLRGYYWTTDDCGLEGVDCKLPSVKGRTFGVMENISGSHASLLSVQGVGKPISLNWEGLSTGNVNVEFRVAQGCLDRENLARIIKAPPLKVVPLSSLEVKLEEGFHHFRHFSSVAPGKVKVSEPKAPVAFFISPAKDSSRIDVDRMVADGRVEIEESMARHDYSLGMLMVGFNDKHVERKDRVVSFTSEGESVLSVEFRLDGKGLRSDKEVECRLVTSQDPDGSMEVQIDEPIANIIVSIVPSSSVGLFDIRGGEWDVRGVDGWVSVHGWGADEKEGFTSGGTLKQISFSGLVKDLQVGNFSVSDKLADVRIAGNLTGQLRDGSITFTGDSRFIDVDGHRKTPTRWEALDIGFKIPILLGVPTAIWLALQLLIGALRQKAGKVWRPYRSYRYSGS